MKKLILLSTALLTLSACKTMEALVEDVDSFNLPAMLPGHETTADALVLEGQCPQIEVLEELRSYDDFADQVDPSESTLISRVNIARFNTACNQDVRTVTVDLKINFEGMLGPRGRGSASDKPFFSYPFFVAIAGPNGKVLSKEIFAASITYPPGANRQNYSENMRFILPVENRDQGARQKILVGFQLSPDQLAYNRKRIELKKEQEPPVMAQKIP
jgi:hypothetical protein